jgi:RNA polymerase sigma factor (sigma-70 family)
VAQTQLLQRIIGGDVAAYRQLVADHQQEVWRIFVVLIESRKKTEQRVAEVFVDLFFKLKSIESEKAFGQAARSTARKRVRAELEKQALEKPPGPVMYREYLIEQFGEDQAAADYQYAVGQGFNGCAKALPEPPRHVMQLYWGKGLKPDAIAEQIGRPASAVRQLLTRVRLQLSQCLMKEFGRT